MSMRMTFLKNMRIVIAFMILVSIFSFTEFVVRASEQLTGEMQSVSVNTDAYDSKSTTGKKVTVSAGSTVLVVGEESGWVHIVYKGDELYIKKDNSSNLVELQNSETAQELQEQAQIDKAWTESYVAQMKAVRNARIWRTIIILLIVSVTSYVVFSGIRRNAEASKEKASETNANG